jgi:hypothetical protein
MAEYIPNIPVSEVRSVEVHSLDVRVSSNFLNTQSRPPCGLRGRITSLSDQSRRRLIFKARNISNLVGFVTLTFPASEYADTARFNYMRDGESVKKAYYQVRKWLMRRGIGGLWFLEFQKRGAPHFHIFTTRALSDIDVDDLRSYWWSSVRSGCPHHRRRGVDSQVLRKRHAAGSYAAKYSSKTEQKTVPEAYSDVGRFWGTFGIDTRVPELVLPSLREIFELARVARNAEKAYRRSLNLPRRRNRKHSSGVRYSIAPAVRVYLERRYTLGETPERLRLLARSSPILELSRHRPVDT